MYKKSITYEDYDGNLRTEEHWFNLTKAELTRMNLSTVGGLKAKMEKMIALQDAPSIMQQFEDILRLSYGQKSPDGRRFIKSDKLFAEFQQTEAYSELYMELISDPKAAAEFINGIIPSNLNPNATALTAPSAVQ